MRWKRSKMRGSDSAAMPIPVSFTVRTGPSSPFSSRTSMPPSKVNLNALASRLRTTFSHMSRSTHTGRRSGAQCTSSASPAFSHAPLKLAARSAVAWDRSIGS
jgi:hypothetical protein